MLRRSPHGERGLKLLKLNHVHTHSMSLPPRGAWIEIMADLPAYGSLPCRSPHGERGLKSTSEWNYITYRASLPPRGAWIEIGESRTLLPEAGESLPPRGAWIEIWRRWRKVCYIGRRSPHGERGLKSATPFRGGIRFCRSPHGERGLK